MIASLLARAGIHSFENAMACGAPDMLSAGGGQLKLLFSSHLFIFGFLPLAIVAIYFVRRLATRQLALCAMILASLLFYYFNGLAQLPVLVLSVLVNQPGRSSTIAN